MKLVSIIVPIYRVADYLERCVNSLLEQSYRNIEVILVDDGSPDDCPKLCDEFAKQDTRIRVIHKQNGGLSDARNVGIHEAIGEYILFVDGDDFWMDKDGLRTLMEQANKHSDCDVIGFNCSYYYPSTNTYKQWVKYDKRLERPQTGEHIIPFLIKSGTFPMSACSKLIKRHFINEKHLFFIKGIYSEDIPWFIDLMLKTKKACFLNLYIYAYRKEVSQSISSSYSEKKFMDLYNSMVQGINLLHRIELSDTTKDALFSFWAYEYCILSGSRFYYPRTLHHNYKKLLKPFHWLMKHQMNPKVAKVAKVKKIAGWTLTCLFMYLKLHRTK